MKLVYYNLNFSMEIIKGELNSVVLENPKIYERFVMQFAKHLDKKESYFAAYDGEKEKDLVKCCCLITTPFNLAFERKEVQKKLFSELEGVIVEQDLAFNISEWQGKIAEALDQVRLHSGYDLEYTEDFSIVEVLKNYDVHLRNPEGDFAERLIEYMKIMASLLGKDTFVIANCDAYMVPEDYEYIRKCAEYYGLYIILVQSYQNELLKLKNEYIIDIDLCEIH